MSRGAIATRAFIALCAVVALGYWAFGSLENRVYTGETSEVVEPSAISDDPSVPPLSRPPYVDPDAVFPTEGDTDTYNRKDGTAEATTAPAESAVEATPLPVEVETPDPTSAAAVVPPVARTAVPEPLPPVVAAVDCLISNAGGDVRAHVRPVACFLAAQFDISVLGRRATGVNDNHPDGVAVDLIVGLGSPKGQQIADCAVRHFQDWNLTDVIWNQSISLGGAFRPMEDRGSDTANHRDHVHLSFSRTPVNIPPINLDC